MQSRLLAFPPLSEPLSELVRQCGFELTAAADLAHAESMALEADVDLLLLPARDESLQLVERLSIRRPETRVVLCAEETGAQTLLGAIRAGAFDVIGSPVTEGELSAVLDRATRRRGLEAEVRRLRVALEEAGGFGAIIGASPPMLELYDLLDQASRTQASVLISGESGTGKELVARALHDRGPRESRPFVAVNCAAIPEALLESELFGHVRGAFTDARQDRTGLFQRASGGTVFLDEIGEMPLGLQPKLLRALQERRIRPVGGDDEVDIDVRVVAASNRALEGLVSEGTFREDLYYRLNVIQVTVPPLRDRGSDVMSLSQHYLAHFATVNDKAVDGITAAAARKLLAYPWPGNVRELQNCIERAVALARGSEIEVGDLPDRIREHKVSNVLVVADKPSAMMTMEEVERRYIERVMTAAAGNKRQAARVLGLDRKTLYRKLERYGIRWSPTADPS